MDVPIWLARERSVGREPFTSLNRDLQADIAVIGGGATGAAVAWRFAEAGVSVVLVEGRRIGRGSTGASTALLMQEPDEDFTALAHRYGRARALRIWELSRESTHEFVATLDRLDISCDLQPRDSVYYATTARHAGQLRSEHRMRV